MTPGTIGMTTHPVDTCATRSFTFPVPGCMT